MKLVQIGITYHRRDFPKVPSLWQQRADLVYDCRRPTKYNHEAGQRLLQHVSLKHNKFVARELLHSETIQGNLIIKRKRNRLEALLLSQKMHL